MKKVTKIHSNDDLLFLVDLEITRRCNLRCIFCSVVDNSSPIIPFQIINKLLEKLSTMTHRKLFLWITGGEPLLVNYAWYIRDLLSKNINIELIGMNTNGTLINELQKAEILVANYDIISVSIDGPRDLHNMIRGKKIYEATINGLKTLLKAKTKVGANTQIVVNTVLTKMSLDSIEEFFDFLIDLGVDGIKFTPMFYDKNTELYQKYGLEPSDAKKLEHLYLYLKRRNKLVPWFSKSLLCNCINYIKNIPSEPNFCGCGRYFIFISADGYIYPCYRIRSKKLASIHLSEIISGTLNHSALIERITQIRNRKRSSCMYCSHVYNLYLSDVMAQRNEKT